MDDMGVRDKCLGSKGFGKCLESRAQWRVAQHGQCRKEQERQSKKGLWKTHGFHAQRELTMTNVYQRYDGDDDSVFAFYGVQNNHSRNTTKILYRRTQQNS